jgi:hypothetical protein
MISIKKTDSLVQLEESLEQIKQDILTEQTRLSIIRYEITLLQENRNLGARNDQVSVTTLQQTAVFYGKRLTALKMDEIERNKNLQDLRR